ncbi:hypothetical protein GCM10010343_36020 [Streptomyces avidinii]|nr:hypothetical protein GCM10010343_36020 [Streptomyces avidinii]
MAKPFLSMKRCTIVASILRDFAPIIDCRARRTGHPRGAGPMPWPGAPGGKACAAAESHSQRGGKNP